MSNVTQIFSQIEKGDPAASAQLLPLVYEELRKLAAAKLSRESPGQTLQATALVHEAYVRLVDTERAQDWKSRGHFFGAAAEAMRRILIESARRKNSLKRGGDRERTPLSDDVISEANGGKLDDLLDLNELLERLLEEDREAGELVKLRLFAGLSLEEAGEALGMSRSTAYDNWKFARAWFGRFEQT